MKLPVISISVLIFLILHACDAPVQEKPEKVEDSYRQSFISANKYIRMRSREHIMAFNERVGWQMAETPTGLWFQILSPGTGAFVESDRLVSYASEVRLLSGKLLYSADTNQPRKVVIGKGDIESGLQEGLLRLREGAHARFMIPPHLAHGNFGDGELIPGAAVLLFEVRILEVKR